MGPRLAIVKKEWRCYFYSPIAYCVIGVFVLLMGFIFDAFCAYYMQYNLESRIYQGSQVRLDQVVNQFYNNMAFVMAFLTPMLTMRLYAEEKRQQTFELLFTSPITGGSLVLGKFLAAFGLLMVLIAISFIYIMFFVIWGTPEIPVILVTVSGLILFLACFLSIGGLISALVSSPAVAAIVNFFVVLLMFLLPALGRIITLKTGPIEWGPTLAYLSPLSHLENFVNGVTHIKNIVFMLSFTGFLLFLTYKAVESNRWR